MHATFLLVGRRSRRIAKHAAASHDVPQSSPFPSSMPVEDDDDNERAAVTTVMLVREEHLDGACTNSKVCHLLKRHSGKGTV